MIVTNMDAQQLLFELGLLNFKHPKYDRVFQLILYMTAHNLKEIEIAETK